MNKGCPTKALFLLPLFKGGKDRQKKLQAPRIKAQGELKTSPCKPVRVAYTQVLSLIYIISVCNKGFFAMVFCSLKRLAAPTK